MKTAIYYILLGVATMLGCSCEPQELAEPTAPAIYVSHDPVPVALVGDYAHNGGDKTVMVSITAQTVAIDLKAYTGEQVNLTLSEYRTIDNDGCWLIIFLQDGRELRLNYSLLHKHGFIMVSLWQGDNRQNVGVYDKVIRK